MSKLTIMALMSWLGGLLILGFQALSSLTGKVQGWQNLAIVDLMDPDSFNWIDIISWEWVQNVLNYFVTSPVYIILFCIGIILFIINAFINF